MINSIKLRLTAPSATPTSAPHFRLGPILWTSKRSRVFHAWFDRAQTAKEAYASSWGLNVIHRFCWNETGRDRKSTRLNSSHSQISYAVFCLKKKNTR